MTTELWRTVALFIAAGGQTTFTLLYVSLQWWKTYLGRVLFFNALTLALLLDLGLLARVIDFRLWDVVFSTLYSCFALGVLAQVIVFVRIGRRVALVRHKYEVSGNRGAS